MMPTVFVTPLNDSQEELIRLFSRAFDAVELSHDFNDARAVFIKPNLTYPSYKEGVTTRVAFVDALVAALRKLNDTTIIYIGEGEGGYNSFSMTDAMRTMGYFELEKKYPNVKIINISTVPSKTVELRANGKPYPIDLPAIFDEIDFSITCPLPKVHCMTGITLSFKNQWGCLPDTMRLKNHYVFDEIIGQVCEKLKFRYAFLDGKFGLDDNGPMMGKPVEINWFAASNSLGAFDMTVSEMMGVNWESIGHLRMAKRYGYLPAKKEINLVGDPAKMKRRFILRRSFWNYPALVAFRSKTLTHLVYFSGVSKILHDIMYTFRKRPINY
jgi:uncharacterized protein (DUF362 family)